MADHLGFKGGMNNRLGYGGNDYGARGGGSFGGNQNYRRQENGTYDDARRGVFLPMEARGQD